MSLDELARRVGVAEPVVPGYLNLTREFPLNRAEDFARVPGIGTEYLLGFAEREESAKQGTIATHLNGDFTEEESIEIRRYVELVRKVHRN